MDTAFLRKSKLFRGMTEEEILSALACFHAQEKRCKKGQALLHAGDLTEKLGLVLEGSVTVESNDAVEVIRELVRRCDDDYVSALRKPSSKNAQSDVPEIVIASADDDFDEISDDDEEFDLEDDYDDDDD